MRQRQEESIRINEVEKSVLVRGEEREREETVGLWQLAKVVLAFHLFLFSLLSLFSTSLLARFLYATLNILLFLNYYLSLEIIFTSSSVAST